MTEIYRKGQEIKEGYCHCGCGNKTKIIKRGHAAKGYVKGEYYKYFKGHNGGCKIMNGLPVKKGEENDSEIARLLSMHW